MDVIGFDMYDMDPVDDKEEVWFGNLRKQLEIVQNFADEHGKLMAVDRNRDLHAAVRIPDIIRQFFTRQETKILIGIIWCWM